MNTATHPTPAPLHDHLLKSRIFTKDLPAPADSPYKGLRTRTDRPEQGDGN
ncbi:hypothetical protein [Exilibacterium tricleocarpae]|uniref:hypothetical protein n=1 Tax=Exilibacterium tricleocarpae TaxID=2591008 RepID=UPI0015D45411|nr:hypothetical protein [Exilibacterium tricleocarpae]